MSHFIKKCIECGDVFAQCRCFDENKPVIYGICGMCLKNLQGSQKNQANKPLPHASDRRGTTDE